MFNNQKLLQLLIISFILITLLCASGVIMQEEIKLVAFRGRSVQMLKSLDLHHISLFLNFTCNEHPSSVSRFERRSI